MTFLEKNSLKQRILVPEHQAFVGGVAVSGLEVVQVGFVYPNGFLELLDVLCAALTERGLSLPVSLFALFRCRVDLAFGHEMSANGGHMAAVL
jgi:hypothetical protein